MPTLYLYDSVTLQHFAVAEALPLLSQVHRGAAVPRWSEHVRREVEAGAGLLMSHDQCQAILDFPWLGDPVEGDLVETLSLRARLDGGNGADKHLGEAESIVIAQATGAVFVTDDGPAYDFAAHRSNLGPAGVQEACAVLWTAGSAGLIDEKSMERFHQDVFDAQRTMRCRCRLWPGGDSLDDRIRALRRR